MQNGQFQFLEEVVNFYNNPRDVIKNPINIDSSSGNPLRLTVQEKANLVKFMKPLTDKQFPKTLF